MIDSILHAYEQMALYYEVILKLQNPKLDTRKECLFLEQIFLQQDVKPKAIIDLGCGTGRMTNTLQKQGYRVIGIDASTNMLSIARQKCPDATFIKSRIENVTVPADVAICWWTTYNYLKPAEFAKLVKQLHKTVNLVVLDSSNYNFDNRSSSTVKRIKWNDVAIEQKRKWWRKGRRRFIDYTYNISDGAVTKRMQYRDVSYWYSVRDLCNQFGKRFELQAAYGDYDINSTYQESKSKRLITVWAKRQF